MFDVGIDGGEVGCFFVWDPYVGEDVSCWVHSLSSNLISIVFTVLQITHPTKTELYLGR